MPLRPSSEQPRLSIIDEDSDVVSPSPSSPPTASHRPFSRRWHDKPPAANYDRSPPKYSVWDVSGPRGEKLMDMRNNKYIVRRGGWKRLCLVFLVLAIIALALGIGLGVGLRKSRNDGFASSNSSQNPTDPFPIGSYTFSTNLDSVFTDCTANPATWSCYPYITYKVSPRDSLATFQWIIQGPLQNLTISSSNNPFAISFTNVSLSLTEAGTDNEHYSFSFLSNKLVYPNSMISGDNSNAACYFNNTELVASLYTRRQGTNVPAGNSTSNDDASTGWTHWPSAIEVNQTIGGGSDVPNCYTLNNGALGSRITEGLQAQPTQSLCKCAWRNFDL